MNKNYFGILLALMMLVSIGTAAAALSQGTWTSNNDITLSITNGQSAEFRYDITALTQYGGKYSISLFRDGSSSPLYNYVTDKPTVGNSATGTITITPSQYGNAEGTYTVIISSSDIYTSDTDELYLQVVKKVVPVTAACTAAPTSGRAPLLVTFNSQVSGGTGAYSYSWTFADGATSSSQNSATHTYNEGTYNPTLKISDANDNTNTITVICPAITVTKPLNPLTVSCDANPKSGTTPLNVAFTSTVTGGTGSFTYSWTFADGSTSNSQNTASHTYTTEGTYAAKLTITDTQNNNNQVTANCGGNIVITKPVIPITGTCIANPTSGTSPLNIILNVLANGGTGLYSYTWNFGDSSTGTSQNSISHSYSTPNIYNPIVMITDSSNSQATISCGTITVSKPVVPLTVTCSANPTSGNTPLNVAFNSQVSGGSGIYTYSWTFADGATSASQNTASHTYNIEGTYITKLTITDSNNAQATANCGNIVATKPIPPITVTCNANPKSGTTPLSVTFTSAVTGGTGIYNYKWTFADGTTSTNAQTTSHTYTTEGTYTTKLTVTDSNNAQATANCGNIVVNKPIAPLTGFCSVNPVNGTSPLTVTLNIQPSGGVGPYTYKWLYGDGTTNNNPSSTTHVYTTLGINNALVTITDSENNQATISCESITVFKQVTPLTVTCTANPLSGKTPLNVAFNSQVSGGTGTYTYSWTFGDGYTSSSQNSASHTYNTEGTYATKLTITDSNNAQATANCGNIVVTKPITPIIGTCVANPLTGTTPLNVLLSVQASGGTGTYSYSWNFGDSTTGTNLNSISHTYNTANIYNPTVKITDSNNAQATISCGTITANKPIIPITVTCSASPTSGNKPLNANFNSQVSGGTGTYTYSWTFGDGSTSSSQNTATHIYNEGTFYPTLKITDSQNNQATANCGTIKATKPITPLTGFCSVNPVNGTSPLTVTLNIQPSGGVGPYTYTWMYGDGTTNNNPSTTTHTYTSLGINNALVKITDSQNNQATISCESITVFKQVTPLTVTCTATPLNGNIPLNVNFNSQISGGTGSYSYRWTFADGTTSNNPSTSSHTYNTEGTYATKLTITDSNNAQATTNCGNVIVTKPITPLTVTCNANPLTGKTPLNVQFTSTVSGGTGSYTYLWTFADGSTATNQNSISHTYDTANIYYPNLKITDSANNQATMGCGTIKVDKPIQPITVTCSASPLNGNTPLNVNFNSQPSGGTGTYTYKWSLGDGSTSNTPLYAAHTYNTEGTFTTKLTITDSNSAQATANCGNIIATKPIAPITATCSANPTSGTTPLNVLFNVQTTGGTGTYSYTWSFGDSTTGTNQNSISHTYNTANTYNPTVKITDSANNQATISCGTITTTIPIPPLTASCSASPTTGNTPLNINFNSQVSGGTGTYTYSWTFGDGAMGNSQNSINHIYTTAGRYNPTLKIVDSKNNAITVSCTDANGINVIKPTPVLNIDSITCFPRITDGKEQSCSVFVKSSDGMIAGNVNINVYYNDGTLFGNCVTDRLSGGCEVKKVVYGVGTYTVYATANAQGFVGDNDKNPKFTFEVFAQRYDVINLDTYRDSNFQYVEHTFYRGQPLYAKFQVYDPIESAFVNNDIVTAASLVSLPGGRVDLSRITYSGNWYYYKLDAIPLNHDFLGGSNVFAFAFNFTGLTSGEAQVDLTILNNKPTISNIADVYVKVGQTYIVPLNNYGTDLEDKILRWQITSTPSKFSTAINSGNVLSITGISSGDDSLTLRGYDLDNDFAGTMINVHVLPIIVENNLTVSCSAAPNSGNTPLNVMTNSVVAGGSGTYTYLWSFGDGTVLENGLSTLNHIYDNEGTFSISLTVTDSNNHVVSANCGQITVNEVIPTLTAACSANPTSGIRPLNTQFTGIASGGIGPYTYVWTFGDGQSATTSSTADTTLIFAHAYNIVGTHDAVLTITDSQNNIANADCGQITVNEVPQINLDVNCLAIPNTGTAPLNAAVTSVVSNGVGPYNIDLNFGNGISTNTVGSSSINTQVTIYNTPGTYYPSISVTDANGNIGYADCGFVVVNQKNVIYPVANAGGPYTGYINEPVTFDASLSVGNITNYRWDFGDGSGIIDTTSPTIEHTYAKINLYNVKLTIFDVNGYNVDAKTTATIIEHSNYKNITVKDVPDKGILIEQIQIYGQNGEILKQNDDMSVNVLLKNEWISKLENVRIIVSIPELGLETRSSLFDFRKGAEYSDTLTLPLYNVKPGAYYVSISVDNDQGDNQVRRLKYREVIVK